MNQATGISLSRQNYLIIEHLLGHHDWEKAAQIPTRVGYHDGRKVKLSILKVGNIIKSCVGYENEKYIVMRLAIDRISYDLKLHPSKQKTYVWVYHDGRKRYDVRKTESNNVLKRQNMLSNVLHVSLKKLHESEIKLRPIPGAKPGPVIERRKGQQPETPKRRITD